MTTPDPKHSFYQHFLGSEAALKDEIASLPSSSSSPNERQAAIDNVLAGIARLQNEVADAAEYTPAYDRKQYSEALKALQESLNEAVSKVAPKSRFQFKRTTKASPANNGAPKNDPRLHPQGERENTYAAQPAAPPSSKASALGRDDGAPVFNIEDHIAISSQTGLATELPEGVSCVGAAGSLTNLRGCTIDMFRPTSGSRAPLPGLSMRNISKSFIVVGRVGGAVHMTGVTDSVIVVTARQVRIHECSNVDLYLHCASHPIIEDCSGMRFAPLPKHYMTSAEEAIENQWDHVDDFKWLKAGHSPNWSILPEEDRVDDKVWANVVTLAQRKA